MKILYNRSCASPNPFEGTKATELLLVDIPEKYALD